MVAACEMGLWFTCFCLWVLCLRCASFLEPFDFWMCVASTPENSGVECLAFDVEPPLASMRGRSSK